MHNALNSLTSMFFRSLRREGWSFSEIEKTLKSFICEKLTRKSDRIRTPFPVTVRSFRDETGISLVEIMVALGMLAMVSVGLILGQLQSNRLAAKARSINAGKVALRQMVDRFQTVSKTDALLSPAASYTSDSALSAIFFSPLPASQDMDSTKAGIQVALFDEDPDYVDPDTGQPGAKNKLTATVERTVVYASGVSAATSSTALANATFRIRFSEYGGSPETVLEMSTNRAIP